MGVLGISEVNDLDVEELVEHDVARLEVPVHDVFGLHGLDKVYQLCKQPPHQLLPQLVLAGPQDIVEGAGVEVFEHEVEVLVVAEGLVEFYDVRVVEGVEDFFFAQDVALFVHLLDETHVYYLYSHRQPRGVLLGEHYLPVGAFPQLFELSVALEILGELGLGGGGLR